MFDTPGPHRGGPAAMAVSAVAGYLIGTLASADLAARLASGGTIDLRATGSGNPGAVNAGAALGRGWGWAVLMADIAKGTGACALGARLAGGPGADVAGTASVIGHCYPVWNGFRGGKGVAVSCGQCLATFPVYFPVDLAVATTVARLRGRALPATAVASGAWVTCALVWWWQGWSVGWGRRPGPTLALSAAVTSVVIMARFATSGHRQRPSPARSTS